MIWVVRSVLGSFVVPVLSALAWGAYQIPFGSSTTHGLSALPAMTWAQDLPPPILSWLLRELLRLRRKEGPQLHQPLGVIVKNCADQLLENHRRHAALNLCSKSGRGWQFGRCGGKDSEFVKKLATPQRETTADDDDFCRAQ